MYIEQPKKRYNAVINLGPAKSAVIGINAPDIHHAKRQALGEIQQRWSHLDGVGVEKIWECQAA